MSTYDANLTANHILEDEPRAYAVIKSRGAHEAVERIRRRLDSLAAALPQESFAGFHAVLDEEAAR